MTETLLIFIKNPELGKAKTRIAKTLGDEAALAIYKELLSEMRSITQATNVYRQLWYSSFIDKNDAWSTDFFSKKLQSTGDLGVRMSDAFRQAFAGGAKRVLIIGSDCPFFTAADLQHAFDTLQSKDAVIGPTFDGGYYLLGMNRFIPELFTDIAWSTESVFDSTISVFSQQKITYKVLQKLRDIDYEADVDFWRASKV